MNFTILRSLLLFVLAGFAEIGGGYLVWQWLRVGKAAWIGVIGCAVLILYGVIPTMQTESSFGRVYYVGTPVVSINSKSHSIHGVPN